MVYWQHQNTYMKLSIIIPVYNEKSTILEIIKQVESANLPDLEKEIIIIDDYSSDGTRDILRNVQSQYKVIFHEKNAGKGAAIRSGLNAVTGEYVVIQDADLEYDPNDFKAMIQRMKAENLLVLYGSRRLKKENTQYSGISYYFGGILVTWITNVLFKQHLTDEPTCYKMFKSDFIKGLPLVCERFDFCPEVTALTALSGINILEIPISYHPRHTSEGKKIRWKDGVDAVITLLAYRIAKKTRSISDVKVHIKHVLILCIVSCINLLIFWLIFGFRINNDTDSFILTIERFRGLDRPLHPNRYLNPFYPLMGATVLRWLSPAHVLIVLNNLFYFGIVFFTYGLVRRVFNNRIVGFISSLLIMTSYTMLRYGLTQVQDIGGYFWFLLTLYSGWRWYKEQSNKWLYVGGVAVALGMLTKESGAMAAPFVGILFLTSQIKVGEKIKAFLKFSCVPFAVLLINQYRGRTMGYSSGDWFFWNWKIFSKDFTLIKWLGVNITTYNILWLFAGWGLYLVVKNWSKIDRDIKIFLFAILPSSLSYFSWPIFLSRTVFIAAWFMVPLAAYGLYSIVIKNKMLGQSLLMVCIIIPYVLQAVLGYTPMFLILQDKCHYNARCIWEVFRDKRGNFDDFRLHSDRYLE